MNLMFYFLCIIMILWNVFEAVKNFKASQNRIDKFKHLFVMGVLIVSIVSVSFVYFKLNMDCIN